MFEGADLGGCHLRGRIQICGLEQESFVEFLIARVSHGSAGESGKAALKFAVVSSLRRLGSASWRPGEAIARGVSSIREMRSCIC